MSHGGISVWLREAETALAQRDYRRAHEACLRILTADAQFADAFFLLSIIAADHGNFAKALDVVERALRVDARQGRYHAQRGRCLLGLQRPREAFEAAMQALQLDPQDAHTLDTIGVLLTRTGAHAEALQPFRRAVAKAPGNASYQYNLGASSQFVGEFAAAASAYRAALAADPTWYRGWSSLAQVERKPLSAAEVETLERMLEAGVDNDAELHLCHALAKQHEDLGEYGKAFAYLVRGKQRKRAALDYSFATDRELFEAAGKLDFTSAPTVGGHASTEPIFIVGMPRTGTTLVERILSSHADVYAAGELTNFGLMLKRLASTPSNRVLDAETLAAGTQIDAARLGEAYVDSTRPRTGHTRRFIDKMPLNFFYAPLIRRALPNAKIICVRRNPLDTCLSNYRQLFATSFSYYNYAYDLLDTGRYYAAFHALTEQWKQAGYANYLEVHYEDVVASTEAQARRLIEFVGLEWDPACLDFHENAAPVATASSVQVRQPIYRTAVERWRKYEREIEPLRRLLADLGVLRDSPGRAASD